MSENNQMMSVEGQLVGMPLAGPESFSQQQLEYLKRALGVDETVLFEKSIAQGATLSSPTITLSETLNNFDRVRVYWRTWASAYSSLVSEFDAKTGNVYFTCIGGYWNGTNASTFIINLTPNSNLTELSFSSGKFVYLGTAATPSNANGTVIYKVVGIHRIAGGN